MASRFFASSQSSFFLKSNSRPSPGSPSSPRSPRSSTQPPSFPIMSGSPARDERFAGYRSNLSLVTLKPKLDVSCDGFPPMVRPRPSKPTDAMDIYSLHDAYGTPQPITHLTPTDAVLELKLFFCRSAPHTNKPNIRVHNLRAAYMGVEAVTHLIFITEGLPDDKVEAMKTTAHECITMDLVKNDISKSDLERMWWHDGHTPTEDFWCDGMIKHCRFATNDTIPDYASLTHKLADPILNGSESLEDFLGRKFQVGMYHKVEHLMVALKEYFGVDVYPTFVGHGRHPSLFEIGVLYTKDGRKRINHPLAKNVPTGKFLMTNI